MATSLFRNVPSFVLEHNWRSGEECSASSDSDLDASVIYAKYYIPSKETNKFEIPTSARNFLFALYHRTKIIPVVFEF